MPDLSAGDVASLRAQFAEMSKDVPDDPFVLPQDSQRLMIFVAAFGVLNAYLDYPALERNHEVLRKRAVWHSDSTVLMWPQCTNDVQRYKRLFRSSFVVGYRLGTALFQEVSAEEGASLRQRICSLPSTLAHQLLDQVIRDRMQEVGTESIYDLI